MGQAKRGRGRPRLSIRDRVVRYVMKRGEVTVSEVLGGVGRYVTAADAIHTARAVWTRKVQKGEIRGDRKPTVDKLLMVGRRIIIQRHLKHSAEVGQIKRLLPGRYAPRQPKLFDPGVKTG